MNIKGLSIAHVKSHLQVLDLIYKILIINLLNYFIKFLKINSMINDNLNFVFGFYLFIRCIGARRWTTTIEVSFITVIFKSYKI